MPYVYILQSTKNNKYYIGSTTDLGRRITEHNQGKNKATKPNIPYKIIYTEVYKTIKEARQREYGIKTYKGGNAFKKLVNV